jgi:hypothetical protein
LVVLHVLAILMLWLFCMFVRVASLYLLAVFILAVLAMLAILSASSLRLPTESDWQEASGSVYDPAGNLQRFAAWSFNPLDIVEFYRQTSHGRVPEDWFKCERRARSRSRSSAGTTGDWGCFALVDIPAGAFIARDTHAALALIRDGSVHAHALPKQQLWSTGLGQGQAQVRGQDGVGLEENKLLAELERYERPADIYQRNNVQYVWFFHTCWLRTIKTVYKGEELRRHYGTPFWLAKWLTQMRRAFAAELDTNLCVDHEWEPSHLTLVQYARRWIRLPARDDRTFALHDVLRSTVVFESQIYEQPFRDVKRCDLIENDSTPNQNVL